MSALSTEARAGYLAHALLPVYRRRVEDAREVVREALATTGGWYVAYSAGKDSSVLLALVLEEWPAAVARILTGGEARLLHQNLDAVIDWWCDRYPALALEEINADRVFSEEWEGATWSEQRAPARGELRRVLPVGFNGVFLGLRDEESNARRIANKRGVIRQYSADRRDGCAGQWVCCPLARWTTNDVGAYLVQHGIPVLQSYQAEGFQARTTMRLTDTGLQMGAMQSLRQRDPDSYNRLLSRFPELSWWAG